MLTAPVPVLAAPSNRIGLKSVCLSPALRPAWPPSSCAGCSSPSERSWAKVSTSRSATLHKSSPPSRLRVPGVAGSEISSMDSLPWRGGGVAIPENGRPRGTSIRRNLVLTRNQPDAQVQRYGGPRCSGPRRWTTVVKVDFLAGSCSPRILTRESLAARQGGDAAASALAGAPETLGLRGRGRKRVLQGAVAPRCRFYARGRPTGWRASQSTRWRTTRSA